MVNKSDTADDEKIENALKCIDEKLSQEIRPSTGLRPSADKVSLLYVKKAKRMMPAYKALEAENLKVNTDEAAGGISGDYISLYPPGIPLLVPGEEISSDHAEGIKEAIKQELRVQGLTNDGRIKILRFAQND